MMALPPHVQDKMHTIEQQSQRATDLIQQILDFSRQSVLERHPLDLLPFMTELTRLLQRTLPEHIQIELNSTEEAYLIHADHSRIQQVIMNLAVNAGDAMPEGGHLQFSLRTVHVKDPKPLFAGELPPGEWVLIEVADSGSGIPQEVLQRIFEPFFTTKEVGRGTGLGLAQVHGIVQQHDGCIDVETREGQGTTFSLYFPILETGERNAILPATVSLPQGHGQLILLVEDDLATRQALIDSLALLNYRVIQAANGREALTILDTRANEIGLVLSDMVMPEMGGVALTHAMRQQKLPIPIILMSGHPLEKEWQASEQLDLAGLLPKPPSLIKLSRLLAKALST
jgi:CheY-like chemotaxis protein